jgi:hypothetical protein
LEPDEEILRVSISAENFYASLASMRDDAQFIVLENEDPPASLQEARITTFTNGRTTGRFWFIPADAKVSTSS